ncbi:MAG: Thioredoxin-dependent 5'-adenylylsulfate reductase [Nitrosopumilales archaeon]|nr:MAG: Thioredoxin-dependent 5'-adenylylsulfate reductase [Nitrosopumilales archaeon]
MVKFTQKEIDEINPTLKTPQDSLKWALDNFNSRVATASSFGAEDSVLIDMLVNITPKPRIFSLDTGRLYQETYDIMDELSKKYNISFEVMFPDTKEVEEMVSTKGMNLFYDSVENRHLCCGIRKVHPLKKMLSNLDGWITGIRSEQTSERSDAGMLEIDEKFGGIVKINPLIGWKWNQVLDYLKQNNVPYHKLIDNGYPSIGCAPCTRAIKPGEDLRAGRWWWESQKDKECGLHTDHKK